MFQFSNDCHNNQKVMVKSAVCIHICCTLFTSDICAKLLQLRGQNPGTFDQFKAVSNHKLKLLTESRMRG